MRSTFAGIEIARSGLTISQLGLDVTGHNIANVDSAGYTRQRLIQTSFAPSDQINKFKPMPNANIGTGTLIKVLDQVRSSFLDRQYRSEQTLYSYWQSRTQGLTYLQSQFEGEEAATLNYSLETFFTSLTTEAMDTDNRDPRVIVKQEAESLIFKVNSVYERLVDLQAQQDLAVSTITQQINTIASNLAVLNKSIYTYELNNGLVANDLRDQRNLLLDELSSLIDIEYTQTEDGQLTVKIAGEDLVNHTTVRTLSCTDVPNNISGETVMIKMPIWTDTGASVDFTDVRGGELKATIDLRDSEDPALPGIPHFVNQLNNLVRALVQEVNAIHSQGYTYPADGSVSQTGIDFFYMPTKQVQIEDPDNPGNQIIVEVADLGALTAKNFRLSDAITNDVNNVASSSVLINNKPGDPDYNPQMGNNEIIRAIAELTNRKDISIDVGGNKVSIGGLDSFTTSVVVEVATALKHSKLVMGTKSTQLLDVDTQRQSISGVSLDEEMTNLIKYQHAYNGASRVITTMDDAIDKLINQTGRVGL